MLGDNAMGLGQLRCSKLSRNLYSNVDTRKTKLGITWTTVFRLTQITLLRQLQFPC